MTEQIAIEAAVETAAVALREGRLEQAEALCNKIIELSPDCAPAYHLISQIASSAEAYEDALELLQRAGELDPANATYRLDSGRVNLALNRIDAALRDADEALR